MNSRFTACVLSNHRRKLAGPFRLVFFGEGFGFTILLKYSVHGFPIQIVQVNGGLFSDPVETNLLSLPQLWRAEDSTDFSQPLQEKAGLATDVLTGTCLLYKEGLS